MPDFGVAISGGPIFRNLAGPNPAIATPVLVIQASWNRSRIQTGLSSTEDRL